jgi:hypothetical protein
MEKPSRKSLSWIHGLLVHCTPLGPGMARYTTMMMPTRMGGLHDGKILAQMRAPGLYVIAARMPSKACCVLNTEKIVR